MAERVNRRKTIIHHATNMERWIIPAILLSLLVHVGISFLCQHLVFFPALPEKITLAEEPTFKLESVSIDPKVPQVQKETQVTTLPEPTKLPDELPQIGKRQADIPGLPTTPQITNQLLSEKPTASDAAKNILSSSYPAVENRSNLLEKQLLTAKPDVTAPYEQNEAVTQALRATDATRKGAEKGGRVAGFSNLDALLAQTGPLQSETAPILMPTDVLFDYDHDMLKDQAMGTLQKLGLLIQRNPTATFLIEGHSDSFGSDEYNLVLSQRRAESVKAWLVQTLKIDPARIETRGFGKTRLLAPATGDIQQQQLNRRVEIVIRTH
ncbi:MAG: OmpA family protein [Chthoniobacterales bacterium]